MKIYDIEEIILGMADIVEENRMLRWENARLERVEIEYQNYLKQQIKDAQEGQRAIFQAVIVGAAKESRNKEDLDFAKKICSDR